MIKDVVFDKVYASDPKRAMQTAQTALPGCRPEKSAPLYYIGLAEGYPPMRFIVSDDDIKSRYEQTMLTLSTLRCFDYSGFDHVVMHGGHCAYCRSVDDDGHGTFGKMVYAFIKRVDSGS